MTTGTCASGQIVFYSDDSSIYLTCPLCFRFSCFHKCLQVLVSLCPVPAPCSLLTSHLPASPVLHILEPFLDLLQHPKSSNCKERQYSKFKILYSKECLPDLVLAPQGFQKTYCTCTIFTVQQITIKLLLSCFVPGLKQFWVFRVHYSLVLLANDLSTVSN